MNLVELQRALRQRPRPKRGDRGLDALAGRHHAGDAAPISVRTSINSGKNA